MRSPWFSECLSGIVVELLSLTRQIMRSSVIYLALGWIGLLGIKPIIASLTPFEFDWVMAGGMLYTGGVPFYLWKSRRHTHTV